MARWYLTCDAAMDRLASEACERSGLKISGRSCEDSKYFLTCYSKRAIHNENLYRAAGGNWACAAGTLILNGKIGNPALSGCYKLFCEQSNGPGAVQDTAIGHFAQAIKRGDEITVFVDALGALSLYYCETEAGWFVSNSLSLCAEAASSRRIDSTRFLVQVLQTNLPGEETFYSDIKRLFGPQKICIDLADGNFRVEQIPARPSPSWDLPSIHDALDRYSQEVRSVFRQIAEVGPVGLFGTGGRDSRTVLSALLDQGADVRMMYGTGNSHLSDYHARDLAIAEEIAGACGDLQFETLDWSGTAPHSDQMLEDLFVTYGFQSEIYGSPQGFLKAFNGGISPYPAIMVGGYSPAFNKAKPWEKDEGNYPLPSLVDDAMHFQTGQVMTSKSIRDKQSYREQVTHGVKSALVIHWIEYPADGSDLKTFVKSKLLLYIRAEARFLNLINEFGHYIAPFMIERLYSPLVEMPFQFRKGDEFQIRLIQMLKPELVKIPLYSGSDQAYIDPVTMQLVREPAPTRPLWKRALGKTLPQGLKDAMKGRAFGSPANDPDSRIRHEYGTRVMQDSLGLRWFSATDDFSPKDLARIYQYLKGVNLLGYEISG